MPYNRALLVEISDNLIFCSGENTLFYYDKEDYSLHKLTKSDGFSDAGITAMSFNQVREITLFGYQNGNLDILEGNIISNYDAIKKISVPYAKEIHDIDFHSEYAYLTTVFGVSLDIVGRYAGILAVYFGRKRNLVSSEIDFLTALGEQGAIALHKALRYDEKMLKTFSETVEGLALALEAKDLTTHGHSQKVALYAQLTALALGLDRQEVATVHSAGLLHDIGKIGMHDRLLTRLGKLNAKELEILRMHPVIGARILEPLTFMEDVAPYVLHHHEHYDGSGYPGGIKGAEIPLGARILAVCDAFDTMVSGRPHMQTMSVERAVWQLKKQAGIRFDPAVVAALVSVVRENPAAVAPFEPGEDYLSRFKSKITAPETPAASSMASVLKFITSF